MPTKPKLTAEQFAELIEQADELRHAFHNAEGRWPFGLDDPENAPFPDIERAAQTFNGLAESALGFQRMVLGSIALTADARALRKRLTEDNADG